MRTALTRHSGGMGIDIVMGVLLAVACTAVLVAIFALIISMLDLSDGVIRAVNQGIKLLAILVGVRAAVPRGCDTAILRGMLVG